MLQFVQNQQQKYIFCLLTVFKMRQAIGLSTVLRLLSLFAIAQASIYPEGEDKESWDARINAKIDQLHKRDATLKVTLNRDELQKHQLGKLRLRLNQTRTPIPFGK